MAWWGKIIGGTFGFMLGGPLGALLGAALGHNFDRGLKLTDEFGGVAYGDVERVQAAFFTATFSIMGHVAKADGKVTQAEIANSEAIMARMQLDPQQRQAAIKLFNEGKADDFPLEDVLTQFRKECHRRISLIQMFLEIQISTAFSDQKLHPAERKILYQIADALGISRTQLDHLFHLAGGVASPKTEKAAIKEAYEILGVKKDAPDAEIKKAYRRLMNQHHPDKLVSKGLPEEMIKLANEKTQQIKEAYDLIKKSRQT
ncbi:MAG: co-chaperone DjlA [Thiotrichales bacterium]|nr:MAG: co-chaperone DjlA [Thiotrichales bacterium]